MKYMLYKDIILMMILYIASVFYILVFNKKNKRMVRIKKYILSVFIAPASALVECVLISLLNMAFDLSMSKDINIIRIIIVDEIFCLVPILVSFLTITIIFKLIATYKISKKIWKSLIICIAISIVASIIQGICVAGIYSGTEVMQFNPAVLNVAFIEPVYTINRCMLVISSTRNVVKQTVKTS